MISMPEGGAVRDPLGVVVTIFGNGETPFEPF